MCQSPSRGVQWRPPAGSRREEQQPSAAGIFEGLNERPAASGASMSRGINKVILVGNLGRDPETRYMPSGSAVTNLRVATSEQWKDKTTGENQERTEWHSVAMFGRLAEIAAEYLRKGSKVYIEGKLRTRKWQDKTDGKDRYTTEIIADDMQMLDSKGGGASMPASDSAPRRQSSAVADADTGGGAPPSGDFDDDIPF